MVKCQICDQREGTIEIEEARYFNRKGKICQSCFDLWRDGNYKELDIRAMAKIITIKRYKK